MINPMLQFLNQKGNNLAAMINTFTSTVKMAQNPQIALQTLMQNNPNVKKAMEEAEKYIQENGGDVETAFRKYADQNGISAENILQLFRK